MNDVATAPSVRGGWADAALNGASLLWFLVMLVGQWVFLYYIAAFYGPSTLSGNFEAWNTNPFIQHGHVPGDTVGNLAFAAHVMLAIAIVFSGTLQLIPHIRKHATWFHRWNGRVFLITAMLASVAGLWIKITRDVAVEGLDTDFAIALNGVIILTLGALAWRAAAMRDFVSHRRWALRAFMVINGVFFLRLMVFGYIVIARAPPSDLLFDVLGYLSYLLPLALVELYIRAKEGPQIARLVMAGVVLVAAAYLGAGVVGFSMIFVSQVLGA